MSEKNTEKKPAPLNVVQRMERMERVHDNLVAEVQNAFGKVDRKNSEFSELLAAVIDVVGEEQVAKRLQERQEARDKEAAEKAAAGVKLLVEQGTIKAVEEIGEKALIVGRDLDKDGNSVGPGRVQVEYSMLKPEFKEKFKGAKVGTKIPTQVDEKEGVTQSFEVTEVYEFVEPATPSEEQKTNEPPVVAAMDAADK